MSLDDQYLYYIIIVCLLISISITLKTPVLMTKQELIDWLKNSKKKELEDWSFHHEVQVLLYFIKRTSKTNFYIRVK